MTQRAGCYGRSDSRVVMQVEASAPLNRFSCSNSAMAGLRRCAKAWDQDAAAILAVQDSKTVRRVQSQLMLPLKLVSSAPFDSGNLYIALFTLR